ncbi:hypothetical protein ACO2RV_11120 [Ancylobacter sp. VNQ12]|uniref:hypothetical protein n=1 Tax=Ancylobacter sp. VNQ12 TaxID=3400920 RepID=UPI003C11A48E
MNNDPRSRRRARAIALQLEDARQTMIRRAILAVSAGLIAAAGLGAMWHGFSWQGF